jgi:uncharacterized protein
MGDVVTDFFQMAGATAFGFMVLAVVTPSVGYLVAGWVWRAVVSASAPDG